ncbi:bifunctional hydroxymethylpyrimidine kinase/phosphomethylpyrimidine kinase [Brachybacterium sp. EF45031]|nr:bifunctional hydroxymethylpyrimidine kinase/phosphomethylpyrimidine kinase [Brachybacterium sillae]
MPPRGGNVHAERSTAYAGGAVTILVAAARFGARAVHGGTVGTGPHGDLIREALSGDGVELVTDPVPDVDTGPCYVLLEPSGERTFVVTFGAERAVTAEDFARLEPRPGDWLCVSGYTLLDVTRDALLTFLDTVPDGVQVVLDPGAPFADLPPEVIERMLRRTTLWTSNAAEARQLTGRDHLGDAAAVLRRRLAPGAVVVLRDGEDGCHVHCSGRGTHVPGFPQRAIDTNGAGDTHTGALLAELIRGSDWEEAALRANAAAALKVTRRGPVTGPTRAEVEAFLEGSDEEQH